MYGMGYKTFEFTSLKTSFIQEDIFMADTTYEFGNNYLNRVQFQVANSNREIMLDILYVSAATAINHLLRSQFQIFL